MVSKDSEIKNKPDREFTLRNILFFLTRPYTIFAIAFWYLSLFPARIGFDYAEAIRMIRRGESTDWWTGEFFWFLKLTTFGGNFVFLTSLIQLLFFALASIILIFALAHTAQQGYKVLKIWISTPLFGAFAMTLSHDLFLAGGVIILIALPFLQEKFIVKGGLLNILNIVATLALMTSQLGRIIVACNIARILVVKWKLGLTLLLIAVSVFGASNFTVDRFDKSSIYGPLIADLKCVAQHPEARISVADWEELERVANREKWINQVSCALADDQFRVLEPNMENVKISILPIYFRICSQNGPICVLAHLQRSRGTLPPPFFQGPDNQVSLDTSKPIGEGTNIALQQGTELLHPSIDEKSVNSRLPLQKYIELLPQLTIFLINQASWFWGWGGFWLYPLVFCVLFQFRRTKCLISLWPIGVLHLSLILIGPGSFGRYVFSTIAAGVICSINLFVIAQERFLTKSHSRENSK
jgi:hypothetical protein